MKKEIVGTLIILASYVSSLIGCPTCVGRINTDSPPFFSSEFYKPSHEGLDEVYEKLLQDEESVAQQQQMSQKEES